jgi:hypothetical protein
LGKQIQVAALYPDELLFLDFLRSKYDVAILRSFAPTRQELWVETFDENPIGNWMYYIWNRNFHWIPEYAQTKSKDSWYISNKSNAPVIEFLRSNSNKIATGEHGRLYWSKYFSAVGELGYDVATFSKWYDTIVRWVKKNSIIRKDGISIYYLPEAWQMYQSNN